MKQGWVTTTLGEVSQVVSGATPKTSVAEFWDGGVPWATPKDLSELATAEIDTTPRTISESGLRSCGATLLPARSVLLSSRAPIGHVAINTVPMATNQGFKSLVPDTELVDSKFLYWWLKRNRPLLESLGNGATFKEISKKVTAAVPIELPPIEEQRRIAAVLDAADALKAKRRQALAKLDTLAHAIFIDMFGDAESFPVGKLGEHVPTTSGGTPSRSKQEYFNGGHIPWVKSGELAQGLVVDTEERITSEAIAQSSAKIMPPGTVLLAMYGATVGAVATLGIEAATNQAVCCLSPTPEITGPYLSSFLRSAKPQLLRRAAGGAQPNISQSIIRDLDLPLPPLGLQRLFAERVAGATALREKFVAGSNHLDALFASLQQRAFRGEL